MAPVSRLPWPTSTSSPISSGSPPHALSSLCSSVLGCHGAAKIHIKPEKSNQHLLHRLSQGLDPRCAANLFANSVCLGEKTIDREDCFVLRLDAEAATLRARSSSGVQIIRHSLWGYFSQRTGLLVQLEDSHLLRIKSAQENVYWETTMESLMEDYRPIDGVNIAHTGRTTVSSFQLGEASESHTRTRMEETWTVEEVDFNIRGLSRDCFLPPADLKLAGRRP